MRKLNESLKCFDSLTYETVMSQAQNRETQGNHFTGLSASSGAMQRERKTETSRHQAVWSSVALSWALPGAQKVTHVSGRDTQSPVISVSLLYGRASLRRFLMSSVLF